MYMTTLIFELGSSQKMATNGTLVRQTFGATAINHGMHKQLDFEGNMGGIPPGRHLFPLVCKAEKVPQKKKSE